MVFSGLATMAWTPLRASFFFAESIRVGAAFEGEADENLVRPRSRRKVAEEVGRGFEVKGEPGVRPPDLLIARGDSRAEVGDGGGHDEDVVGRPVGLEEAGQIVGGQEPVEGEVRIG